MRLSGASKEILLHENATCFVKQETLLACLAGLLLMHYPYATPPPLFQENTTRNSTKKSVSQSGSVNGKTLLYNFTGLSTHMSCAQMPRSKKKKRETKE